MKNLFTELLTEAAKINPEQVAKWAEENDADWDEDSQILTVEGWDYVLDDTLFGNSLMGEIQFKLKNGKLTPINLDEVLSQTFEVFCEKMRDSLFNMSDKEIMKESGLNDIIKEISKIKV